MEGHKKFQEVGQKLKAEQAAEQEAKEENKQIALNQLEALRTNPELSKLYTDNASVGAANLAGELPLLKVHSVGRSTSNQLSDGSEPNDGWFFYKPTGEQFEEIVCHILTISKGFKAPGIENNGQAKEVFNQILGGVIVADGDYKPFIFYFTGTKLSYLWEFGKAANKYTHAKPTPIPMFALTVKLTTSKEVNSFGKSWVVHFDIMKNTDGFPQLVMDAGEFQFLKDSVETVETTIASVISNKTNQENIQPLQTDDQPF